MKRLRHTYKSWLTEDGTRQYRIFYREGFNRLSLLSDKPPERAKKIKYISYPAKRTIVNSINKALRDAKS